MYHRHKIKLAKREARESGKFGEYRGNKAESSPAFYLCALELQPTRNRRKVSKITQPPPRSRGPNAFCPIGFQRRAGFRIHLAEPDRKRQKNARTSTPQRHDGRVMKKPGMSCLLQRRTGCRQNPWACRNSTGLPWRRSWALAHPASRAPCAEPVAPAISRPSSSRDDAPRRRGLRDRNWRWEIVAQGREQLDLPAGKLDEHGGDANARVERPGGRPLRQHIAIDRFGLAEVRAW